MAIVSPLSKALVRTRSDTQVGGRSSPVGLKEAYAQGYANESAVLINASYSRGIFHLTNLWTARMPEPTSGNPPSCWICQPTAVQGNTLIQAVFAGPGWNYLQTSWLH